MALGCSHEHELAVKRIHVTQFGEPVRCQTENFEELRTNAVFLLGTL